MRPRRLVVRGFRSYAEETSFDFDGRNLVGVVGPIGSGKSTLLDAISFALYGQTPTVGKQTKSLINQRQDSAHVELSFDVGNDTWRAVRALRRKGQSGHSLERLIDGERHELIEGEKATNAKVAELLGLDFHAFGRSALLAQNQFARFLDATGGERDAVLKGVFGLDRLESMRHLAKGRRDDAARDLEELERRRAQVEADKVALAAARAEHAPLAERAAQFTKAAGVAAKISGAEAGAADELMRAKASLVELEELAGRLPSRTDTSALLAASLADADAIAEASAALERARTELEASKAKRTDVVERTGDREALARLEADVARAVDLAEAVRAGEAKLKELAKTAERAGAESTKVIAALERAAEDVSVAEEGLARAGQKAKEAEAALHSARHQDMAQALRAGIGEGDPCPVCGRAVDDLPVSAAAPLTKAEKAVKAAQRELEAAEARQRQAHADHTKAAASAAAASARVEESTASLSTRTTELDAQRQLLAGLQADLSDSLGEGDHRTLLDERRSLLESAESEFSKCEKAVAEAHQGVAALEESAADRTRGLQRLATEVAALGGSLGGTISSSADHESISQALDQLRELWETRAAAAEDAVKEASKRLEASRRDRGELHTALGLSLDADFEATHLAAQTQLAAVTEKVALLEVRVDRVAALEKENAVTVERLATFTRIVDDLAPSRLLAFLLDEERVALAELAAERFEMLSGGRYRFTEDGSFDVLDLTAADAVRKPRSLSGGETFLASLALALALAEMVSRSGGRLGAFFLDEGFGSLDAEHLDLAMEGVERIVADDPDRLIIVVSHVPELRGRLEDVIELDKHPVTGDTMVARP